MPEIFTIRIQKEALKFASSHMTVFPDGTKEALHGHQYMPRVTIGMSDETMLPFVTVKSAMKKISDCWDEKLLLAEQNKHFKMIQKTKKQIDFTLCKKEYSIPADEVELLPIQNVTCECLAQLYSNLLVEALPFLRQKPILFWTVEVDESPGQGASYQVNNNSSRKLKAQQKQKVRK